MTATSLRYLPLLLSVTLISQLLLKGKKKKERRLWAITHRLAFTSPGNIADGNSSGKGNRVSEVRCLTCPTQNSGENQSLGPVAAIHKSVDITFRTAYRYEKQTKKQKYWNKILVFRYSFYTVVPKTTGRSRNQG